MFGNPKKNYKKILFIFRKVEVFFPAALPIKKKKNLLLMGLLMNRTTNPAL